MLFYPRARNYNLVRSGSGCHKRNLHVAYFDYIIRRPVKFSLHFTEICCGLGAPLNADLVYLAYNVIIFFQHIMCAGCK